jgi:hypothetical protein
VPSKVVVTDGLYLEAPFFNLFLDHGKHVISVLKDERRDLMEDARGLFEQEQPLIQIEGNLKRQIWDIEGFTSWQSLKREIRVVRCVETRTVRRQRTGKLEEQTSQVDMGDHLISKRGQHGNNCPSRTRSMAH